MIEISNLFFNYQNKEVLKIKNLKLNTNKISILMGANGSGKSTFLRILKFLEGDFSKNISYFGNFKPNNKQKREIYLLFPEPILLNRSVRANFLFTLKTYGIKEDIEERIKESLMCLNLDESLLSKYPNELSSGQSQKIAFAIALSVRAKYYLLDEPSAFLDKNTTLLFKKAILKMHKNFNTGFLIASHDKHFLDSLAQKKLYLHSGEILEFENTNVFDLEKGYLYLNQKLLFNPNFKKITINPYKIAPHNNFQFKLENCEIIALRTKKDFIYVRVVIAEKILEFALSKNEFLDKNFQLYQKIHLSFNEDAIYYLN